MGWQDGQVNGQDAQVKVAGQRIEAISNLQNNPHDHIVSNDGLNADYVREGNRVIVDNSKPNPYEPYNYR